MIRARLVALRDELKALRPSLDDATAILLDVLLADLDQAIAENTDELSGMRILRRLEPLRDLLSRIGKP
jgi:hypothetical protein